MAIDLPQEIKKNIYHTGYPYFSNNRSIRAVKWENIHITLKFLGNIQQSLLPGLIQALNQAVKKDDAFQIKIDHRIDAFPNKRKASIIFVGIAVGGPAIENIFNHIEKELANINIEKEKRKFLPHATIARVKRKMDIASLEKEITFGSLPAFKCDRITLFESKLQPGGAEYAILDEFFLK